jgi:hypothetical protein
LQGLLHSERSEASVPVVHTLSLETVSRQ